MGLDGMGKMFIFIESKNVFMCCTDHNLSTMRELSKKEIFL